MGKIKHIQVLIRQYKLQTNINVPRLLKKIYNQKSLIFLTWRLAFKWRSPFFVFDYHLLIFKANLLILNNQHKQDILPQTIGLSAKTVFGCVFVLLLIMLKKLCAKYIISQFIMGSQESAIYDIQGQQIKNKKCIILVTPPSYEISKLVSKFPEGFGYEYISIGQMIRDQINKKTNYSKIIMDNLEKDKKINDKILDILLKNATLLGNFMIRFAPIDGDEVSIWKKFINKANIEMTIIIEAQPDENVMKRPSYRQKFKEYEKDVERIKDLVSKNSLLIVGKGENPYDKIIKKLQQTKK